MAESRKLTLLFCLKRIGFRGLQWRQRMRAVFHLVVFEFILGSSGDYIVVIMANDHKVWELIGKKAY